jgi:hypothetical protein
MPLLAVEWFGLTVITFLTGSVKRLAELLPSALPTALTFPTGQSERDMPDWPREDRVFSAAATFWL